MIIKFNNSDFAVTVLWYIGSLLALVCLFGLAWIITDLFVYWITGTTMSRRLLDRFFK